MVKDALLPHASISHPGKFRETFSPWKAVTYPPASSNQQLASFFFIGLLPPVRLPDGLHGTNTQNVPTFRNIRLHAWEHLQAVKDEGVTLRRTVRGDIAVDLIKALGIEIFCQTDCIQTGPLCFL